ncbi:GTP-binding protein required for 40S ribosome biogenesis [Enterocytozoon bieneusi H348]|nr:GTP-binding protein required for 40S ribosome biogenesis [Enterocytozoon bieneusi H348]|eukprot:XP_002649402.1 GTP-binding protein required for 40S ribosome biogenesis [Enterocytozoon bieneusi H348]
MDKIKSKKITWKNQKKQDIYNEYHSKVVIQNMFYKDNSPALVTILSYNKIDEYRQLFKIIHSNTLDTVCISNKYFDINYVDYTDFDKIIDAVKVSDLIIFDIDLSSKNNDQIIRIMEVLSMSNAHGQIKTVYSCINQYSINNSIKQNIEKQLKTEHGLTIKILNTTSLKLFLSKFKIRPISFKCNNSYIVPNKIYLKDNICEVYGYLRGKPIENNQKQGFAVSIENEINILQWANLGIKYMFNNVPNDNDDQSNDEVYLLQNRFNNYNNIYAGSMDSSNNLEINNTNIISDDLLDTKNSNYHSKKLQDNTNMNFLMTLKQQNFKEYQLKTKILKEKNYAIPGDYIHLTIHRNEINSIDDISIIALTNYHLEKSLEEYTSGNITVNKYYKNAINDLNKWYNLSLSNISVGWHKLNLKNIGLLSIGNIITTTIQKNNILLNIKYKVAGYPFFVYSIDTNNVPFKILFNGKFENNQKLYQEYNLVGYPKIIKINTAIVQGMFTSKEECSRFILAKIITSNGIRGIIKTPIGKQGDFRATFEGNILMSDIILLKVKEELNTAITNIKTIESQVININSCNTINTNTGYLNKLYSKLYKLTNKNNKLDEIKQYLFENNNNSNSNSDNDYINKSKYRNEIIDRRKWNAIKHIKLKNKYKHKFI